MRKSAQVLENDETRNFLVQVDKTYFDNRQKIGAAHVEVQRRQYDVVKPLEDLTFKYLLEKE